MMESLLKRGVFGAALGAALVAQAAITGSSEAAAASISMSAAGAVRTVKLVAAAGTEKGVYYFKSTLKRGQSYTVWTENVSTNAPVSLDAYAADPPDTSDAMGPGADFDDVGEAGANTRLVMWSSNWTVDDEDPEMSDPKSWTYYFSLEGTVGQSVTVRFRQGADIPQGRLENPAPLSIGASEASVTRALELGNAYYFRARLTAGRLYHFATAGGTAEQAFNITVDGEDDDVDATVYSDAAYDAVEGNMGLYVIPDVTAYYVIVVNGVQTNDAVGTFSLKHRVFPVRAIADHPATELNDANGWTATCRPGYRNDFTKTGAYDEIIDEDLFVFTAAKGERFVCETSGAATNLLLCVYDAKGGVLAKNTTDGVSRNVRAAFTASAAGRYYVGVCQDLTDEFGDVPAYLPVRVTVAKASTLTDDFDAWDPADDAAAGASGLSPLPATKGAAPEAVDQTGHGPHRLGRGDWADVFMIGARKGVTYALRASVDAARPSANTLAAKVFTLSGTSERAVAAEGDLNPGSTSPLTFTATANATYYVRVAVAEGAGLDSADYTLHAMAYTETGDALGILTVNALGAPTATWSLDSETVKYPAGASVLVSGAHMVKFAAATGFKAPAAARVTVAPGTEPTVVTAYYSDTADPADDTARGAKALALKNVATKQTRTLWKDDPEDNFSLSGKDGQFYDFALEDVTGDAVFTITNATPTAAHPDGVFARGVTAVSQLELPAAKTKYYLTVHHADAAAPKDGSYALSGFYANVGTVKFARTSVTARENAASVAITVNRTAKDGRVRVRYGTVAGTAKPGVDYVAQNGVLDWANGDNKAKTITVRLIPDLVPAWESNKVFSVELRPFAEDERADGEYAAALTGGATCAVTLTEVSRAGTTAASSYAAVAPKRATVAKSETVGLETGSFFGVLAEDGAALTNGLPARASLTLTVSTATPAAISAKVALAGKTYSFTAKGWDADAAEDAAVRTCSLRQVQRVANVSYTNTLTLAVTAGRTETEGDWLRAGATAELEMNVPDANGKGVQEAIRYVGTLGRNNAKIQAYLDAVTNFTGYYTVALAPQGTPAADGVPAGNGYLTLTVDNKGTVKVAGVLADGAMKPTASVSGAALVLDDASANGYALLVPVFMARTPQCFGGTLRLYAREDGTVVVDSTESLAWNSDLAAATYANEEGFRLLLNPVGGWYDKVVNLQAYYLTRAFEVETATAAELPAEMFAVGYTASMAAEPNGTGVEVVGDAFATAKKALVRSGTLNDLKASVNPCNVQVKLTRATGLVTGSFSIWSESEDGGKQKEVTGFKHAGVLLLARDAFAPIPEEVAVAGTATKALSWSEKNPDTGRTVSRKWTWSVPFNILGIDQGEPDWWADDWGEPD